MDSLSNNNDGYSTPFMVPKIPVPPEILSFLQENGLTIDYRDLKFGNVIGIGSYGNVHEALYRGMKVAVKELHNGRKSFFKYFLREILSLRRTNHPRIVRLIGVTTDPLTIVMEYVPGGTLHSYLKSQKSSLELSTILRLSAQIAQGMEYLHSLGFLHRDVTTTNILLDENEDIKIVDFGLCRPLDQSEMTKGGSITNPRFRAPELFDDEYEYNEKVDVFSFSLVLCEMVNLKKPFKGLEGINAAYKYLNGFRPQLSNSNEALCSLIKDCWDSDPSKRPTFSKILERIEKIEAQTRNKKRVFSGLNFKPTFSQTVLPPPEVEPFDSSPPTKDGGNMY